MPANPILHVSYDFTHLPDDEIDSFTGGVLAKTYGNTSFPAPPVTAAALTTALHTYDGALAAMADGGRSTTAAKNAAKLALVDLLRAVAAYVESQSANDLAALLSSGFHAASTSHAQTPLPQARIVNIALGANGGSLVVTGGTMPNVRSWEARWKPENAADTAYQHADNLGAVRKMTVINLPSLTRVTLQMRGVGGATGYGGWSDPVTHAVT